MHVQPAPPAEGLAAPGLRARERLLETAAGDGPELEGGLLGLGWVKFDFWHPVAGSGAEGSLCLCMCPLSFLGHWRLGSLLSR